MYNYKMSDDTTKEVLNLTSEQKKKKKVDELLSKINSIGNQFGTAPKETAYLQDIELDRINFQGKTEDEIKKSAEDELQYYKDSSIKKIEQENKNKQDQLFNSKEDLIEQNKDDKQTLSGYYDTVKENASSQALKRGLARSSIIINQLDAFDNNQIDDYKKMDADLSKKIEGINFEINGLSGELENALNDFNISYAVELQNKINGLTEDLQKQEKEVIKYNNEIALKEAEFNNELTKLQDELNNTNWDKSSDLLEIYGKYGANVVNKFISDSLFNETKSYLNSLSKEEALEILSDENIKKSLGSVYNLLLKEFNG